MATNQRRGRPQARNQLQLQILDRVRTLNQHRPQDQTLARLLILALIRHPVQESSKVEARTDNRGYDKNKTLNELRYAIQISTDINFIERTWDNWRNIEASITPANTAINRGVYGTLVWNIEVAHTKAAIDSGASFDNKIIRPIIYAGTIETGAKNLFALNCAEISRDSDSAEMSVAIVRWRRLYGMEAVAVKINFTKIYTLYFKRKLSYDGYFFRKLRSDRS